MNKKLILILDSIVSIALIAVVLYYIGAEKVIAELSQANYLYVLLSLVFLGIMNLIIAYRIQFLLKVSNVFAKFKDVTISHMVGMLLSDFTPARSGYFATVAALSYNYKVPSDKAMVAILGPQALDFMIKVIIGTISMLYVTNYILKIQDAWFILLGAFLMSVMITVMLLLMFSSRFLKLFSFMVMLPILERVYRMFEKMQQSSDIIIKKLPQLLALMFLSWTAKAISWYFVAKAVGITIDIGIPEILIYYFLQPTLTILEFIPSPTIAGIGLSEGGGAVLLSVFGIPTAKAAAFVFLARVKTIFMNLVAVPETLKTAKNLKDDIF